MTIGLALMLAIAPVSVVLASHIFPDVTDGTTHAAAIEHIADAGITAGCGGTANYCPTAAVTRDQMATFIWRQAPRVAMARGTFNTVAIGSGQSAGNAFTIGDVDITVPGADNSFSPVQFVKVDVAASVYDTVTTGKGCECSFTIFVSEDGGDLHDIAYTTVRSAMTEDMAWGLAGSFVFATTPGAHTYEVWAAVTDRATTPAASFDVYLDEAVATTYAFGPTGADSGIPTGSATSSRSTVADGIARDTSAARSE
ncbi:MAG TPA: hypothetical protein VD763_13480 [Candidatus Saccharimonadales bacterium]|nr:hypothetical protein [Candidatus Saccharimonadales bacterium]